MITRFRASSRSLALDLPAVFLSESGASAFEPLKDLLLEIAQERDLGELLPLIVRRVVESSEDVALARIWLVGPGDTCGTCRNASACASRDQCLHLAASGMRPLGGDIAIDRAPQGSFRRIPIGAFKVGKVFAQRAPVVVADASRDPHIKRPDWVQAEKIQSFAGQPLLYREEALGVLGVFVRVPLTAPAVDVLRLLANHAAAAIASARAFDEIARLHRQLESENQYLREVVTSRDDSAFVGSSEAALHVKRQIELVAPTDARVLVSGESGTGKELVAEAIHARSRRAGRPFIVVNCAAIPRELYESEFFGHTKGAFSGAVKDRIGRFEAADGGTLFLDEVGEIPLDLQGKLLRVIEEGTFDRLGETRARQTDVRIVAATNRDLSLEVAAGRFRQDLYYRLNVFPIETPPLRARPEDVALIAVHLLAAICRRMHRPPLALAPETVLELEAFDWPGNVRELKNVLERALISAPPTATHLQLPPIGPRPLPLLRAKEEPSALPSVARAVVPEADIRRLERDNLRAALEATHGRIYGRGGAADLLGVKGTTLASRIRKLGISTRS
jgi:transcriptional regulator with GAF, ATPase, and Fis domain